MTLADTRARWETNSHVAFTTAQKVEAKNGRKRTSRLIQLRRGTIIMGMCCSSNRATSHSLASHHTSVNANPQVTKWSLTQSSKSKKVGLVQASSSQAKSQGCIFGHTLRHWHTDLTEIMFGPYISWQDWIPSFGSTF